MALNVLKVTRAFDEDPETLTNGESGNVFYIFDVTPFGPGLGTNVMITAFTDKTGGIIADDVTYTSASTVGIVIGTFSVSKVGDTVVITPNGSGLSFTPNGGHAKITIKCRMVRGSRTGVMDAPWVVGTDFTIACGSHPTNNASFFSSDSQKCTGLSGGSGKKRSPPKLGNEVRTAGKKVPRPVV